MPANPATTNLRPAVALADYDFLRSIYEVLLRAPISNAPAINAAFEALDAAHQRLKTAHQQLHEKLSASAFH